MELTTTCSHSHTFVDTTGSIRLADGEVTDDLHDAVRCAECFEVVTLPEQPSSINPADELPF